MARVRLSGLALTSFGLAVAAIIGVQLGRSAISEINPIHFQGPLERPQAITPPPEPAPFNPYARSHYWSLPPPPLAFADCGADCASEQMPQAMRLALDEAAGRDPALPYWRDATPTTELRPWTPGAVPGRNVERYLHYPVSREQAERAAPAPVHDGPPAEALRLPPAEPQPVED